MLATLLTLDSIVMRSDSALQAELHGETVLMSIATGAYYGLASSAHAIWQQLAQPTSVRAICARLAAEYAAPATVIETDTLAFLNQLQSTGLIAVSEPPLNPRQS